MAVIERNLKLLFKSRLLLCCLLQPKVLAEMMLAEKKVGKLNDSIYIAYFVDSLSLKQTKGDNDNERRARFRAEMMGISELVFTNDPESNGENATFEVTLSSRIDKEGGKASRSVTIQSVDHSWIWWIVVRLKEYGMKQTEGEGAYIDLKGKGLYAGTGQGRGKYAGLGPHSITIGCGFDKK